MFIFADCVKYFLLTETKLARYCYRVSLEEVEKLQQDIQPHSYFLFTLTFRHA